MSVLPPSASSASVASVRHPQASSTVRNVAVAVAGLTLSDGTTSSSSASAITASVRQLQLSSAAVQEIAVVYQAVAPAAAEPAAAPAAVEPGDGRGPNHLNEGWPDPVVAGEDGAWLGDRRD